jgi:hypothetical protein
MNANDVYWKIFALICLGLVIAAFVTMPNEFHHALTTPGCVSLWFVIVTALVGLTRLRRNALVWLILLLAYGVLCPEARYWVVPTAGLTVLIGVLKLTDFGNSSFGQAFGLIFFALWYAWIHGYVH